MIQTAHCSGTRSVPANDPDVHYFAAAERSETYDENKGVHIFNRDEISALLLDCIST